MPERTTTQPQIVFAFDFGLRRIGIASGDSLTRSARPLATVSCGATGPDWRQIQALLAQWSPTRNVVGLPYNADGTISKMAEEAKRFAQDLTGRFGIPVDFVDERYSSLDAEARLRAARATGARKRRITKSDVDSYAACVILERWFALASR